MSSTTDKFSLYNQIKALLKEQGFRVNPYREIKYGIQFLVSLDGHSELLRIYESKKGTRVDFSQIKQGDFSTAIQACIQPVLNPTDTRQKPLFDETEEMVQKLSFNAKDPDDLIGIDESGKGDYFGPLVIAAVRVDPETRQKLEGLGIADSKKLSDTAIKHLSKTIMAKCQHAVLVMGNESYNEIYSQFENLNHILAWGHMKVLEDTLKQGYCPNALCDQFGNASLLKNSLRAKKLNINLYQRPRAESNLAVACASILARFHFVNEIEKMSKHYEFTLTKGSGKKTLDAALEFIKTHGKKELFSVAKLHFKLTEQLNAKLST